MSVQNFKANVIAANMIVALRKELVFAGVANTSYEGVLKSLGDKVKVNQIADVTVNSYTRHQTLTRQEAGDASTELTADQANYFDVEVDDVDAVMQKQALLTEFASNGAYGLKDTVDTYIGGLYGSAGLTSYATGTTNWDVTALNVEDVLVDAQEKMKSIPRQNRFMIIPEWFHGKMLIAGITVLSDNVDTFTNGFVSKAYGYDFFVSENVSTGTPATGANTRIMAGVKDKSWAFANVITEVEAYRPQESFTDAIKGLHVYAAKVMRPDMTLTIYADKTAEA